MRTQGNTNNICHDVRVEYAMGCHLGDTLSQSKRKRTVLRVKGVRFDNQHGVKNYADSIFTA